MNISKLGNLTSTKWFCTLLAMFQVTWVYVATVPRTLESFGVYVGFMLAVCGVYGYANVTEKKNNSINKNNEEVK